MKTPKLVTKTIQFDGPTLPDEFSHEEAAATVAASADGAKSTITAISGRTLFSFNDVRTIPIDNLHWIEFLFRLSNWSDDPRAFFGVFGQKNVDPSVAPEKFFFSIQGPAVNGKYPISARADDGTNDYTMNTGRYAVADKWMKVRADFKTGTQTLSVPAASTGGKSSIQIKFTDYDGLGYDNSPPANVQTGHLSLQEMTDNVQLFFGCNQNAGATFGVLDVREVCYAYEQVGFTDN